jgi:hypothetical protein
MDLLIISRPFVFIGTLTSLFSTIVAMSKRIKTNVETLPEEQEPEVEQEQKTEILPGTTNESTFTPEKTK